MGKGAKHAFSYTTGAQKGNKERKRGRQEEGVGTRQRGMTCVLEAVSKNTRADIELVRLSSLDTQAGTGHGFPAAVEPPTHSDLPDE